MKIRRLLPLSMCIFAITSCNNNIKVPYTFIAPQGAPTITIFQEIIDGKVETKQNTQEIPIELQKKDGADFVIFDSINTLKLIKAKKADYTYLKMLTIGNFYMAGFNQENDAIPSKNDYIVSFGQGGVTDETLKYVYPELYNDNQIHYVNSVSDVVPILKTGKHEGMNVDWCFIAQPALFNVMDSNNNDENELNNINPALNVLDLVKQKSSGKLNFIPQAGLFVKNSFYQNNKKQVDEIVSRIGKQMEEVISNPTKVKDTLKSLNQETLKKFGGLNLKMFDTYKENTYKEFGVNNNLKDITKEDIQEFLKEINSSTSI